MERVGLKDTTKGHQCAEEMHAHKDNVGRTDANDRTLVEEKGLIVLYTLPTINIMMMTICKMRK